ncbi:DUF4197 domain-containing protein [Ferruginivarius sediminum]|nr:DUF4197 domain-containing protein [Ferruginivarius sediminum]
MRRAIIAAALLLALVPPSASDAAAQSWLDKARETVEGLSGGGGGDAGTLSDSDIAGGLKEALRFATERTVNTVGVEDGFNADPQIHIPLPKSLKTVQSALRQVGMSSMADDLELRLNRAAEAAAPEAKAVFFDAIKQMTWDDARQILDGPKDAATQYFRRTMSEPLKGRMRPIVDSQLAQVGAVQTYDDMMGQYDQIPFVPDAKANLTDYTLDKALDGIFHYLGKEEARIRGNPAARTTDLLKKVFGS